MQSEVFYGARLSAVVRGAGLFFFAAFVYLTSQEGDFLPSPPLIVLVALGGGLWLMRGAIKPKTLVLDHAGVTYQAPLSNASTSVKWPQVVDFAIKGRGKDRELVCNYRDAETGAARALKLGDGWSAYGTSVFADGLDKVLGRLEDARGRYQQQTSYSKMPASKSSVEPVRDWVPRNVPQARPQRADGIVRSGQVYAKVNDAAKSPTIMLSKAPRPGGSRLVAWGLLAMGTAVGVGSAYAFARACKSGMCRAGFWDMPDPSLWIFPVIWMACLWALWAAMRKLSG